jgi:hypothetical protein
MLFTFTRFFLFFVGRPAHSAPFITAELAETAIRAGMFFLFFPFHEQLTVFLYYKQDYPRTGIVIIKGKRFQLVRRGKFIIPTSFICLPDRVKSTRESGRDKLGT